VGAVLILWAHMLRIKLLGAFTVWVDAVQVQHWPRRDARQLLKLLAVQVGHRIAKHQAMEALWPNSTAGQDLDHKLKNAVYALRRALEPQRGQREASHYIQSDTGTISLGPAHNIHIDSDEFERLLDIGLINEEAIPELEQAAALYQGPLLPEDELEPWAQLPRTHLEQRQTAALRTIAHRQYKQGNHERAIATLQRLVRMTPVDEEAHRQLIELFTHCGRPWDAKRQYAACKTALALELGLPPSPQTRDAFLAAIQVLGEDELSAQGTVRIHALPTTMQSARFTSPVPLVSLVARTQETQKIKQTLLNANTRMLTLCGPAGVGKTQLAIRVAYEIQQEYTHGVCYVSLADIANAYAVPGAIGHALKVESSAQTPWEELLANFLANQHLLLVLDNFEHLLDAAPVVCKILTSAPRVTVMATSRVALHLAGETLFPLELLALPTNTDASMEELAQNSSIKLLVQRVQAQDPTFRLTAQNMQYIAAICHRLDGLPLAIELAAARMRLFSPEELAQRLALSFDVLHQTKRDIAQRHYSLEAVLQWSYQLLPLPARKLFNWMGMFSGGATLTSLQGVLQIDTRQFDSNLELLIDHHLVIPEDFSIHSKSRRYSMLQSVRAFSLERLQESGEFGIAVEKFTQYWGSISEYIDQEKKAGNTREAFPLFIAEHRNFESAVTWATEYNPVLAHQLAAMLLQMTVPLGFSAQGRHWIATILDPAATVSSPWHIKARCAASLFFSACRDYEQCLQFAQATMEAAQALGDQEHIAAGLWLKALVFTVTGKTTTAITHVSNALALTKKDTLLTINCLSLSARLHMMAGKYDDARIILDDALLNLGQAKLNLSSISCVLHFHSSFLHTLHGNFVQADQYAAQGLKIARGLNDLVKLLEATCKAAELEIAQQRMDSGAQLISEVTKLNEKIQDMHSSCITDRLLGICAFMQGDLLLAHQLLSKARRKTIHLAGKPERESVLLWLIRCCLQSGALKEARSYLAEIVDTTESICHFHLPSVMEDAAKYFLANGQPDENYMLFEQAKQLRRYFGLVRPPVEETLYLQAAAQLHYAGGLKKTSLRIADYATTVDSQYSLISLRNYFTASQTTTKKLSKT
jgi:predicted ATPase/DNA-binding SARP family transcriptional activator